MVKTISKGTFTGEVVSPSGTFADSLTVSGIPVPLEGGSVSLDVAENEIAFGSSAAGEVVSSPSFSIQDTADSASVFVVGSGSNLGGGQFTRDTNAAVIINSDLPLPHFNDATSSVLDFQHAGKTHFSILSSHKNDSNTSDRVNSLDLADRTPAIGTINRVVVITGSDTLGFSDTQLVLRDDGDISIFRWWALDTEERLHVGGGGLFEGNLRSTATVSGANASIDDTVTAASGVFGPVGSADNPTLTMGETVMYDNGSTLFDIRRGGNIFRMSVNSIILNTRLHIIDGGASVPGIRFNESIGMYKPATSVIAITTPQGTDRLTMSGTGDDTDGVGVNGNLTATGTITAAGISVPDWIQQNYPQPGSGTQPLVSDSPFPFRIDGVRGAKVDRDSVQASYRINGAVVEGLDNLTLNTSATDYSATSNALVSEGDRLSTVFSGSTGAVLYEATVAITRLA